jgi:hypothetical protein
MFSVLLALCPFFGSRLPEEEETGLDRSLENIPVEQDWALSRGNLAVTPSRNMALFGSPAPGSSHPQGRGITAPTLLAMSPLREESIAMSFVDDRHLSGDEPTALDFEESAAVAEWSPALAHPTGQDDVEIGSLLSPSRQRASEEAELAGRPQSPGDLSLNSTLDPWEPSRSPGSDWRGSFNTAYLDVAPMDSTAV